MKLGLVGLGRMGASLAGSAMRHGHQIVGYNKNPVCTRELVEQGLEPAFSLAELVQKLAPPRLVLIYVPHGDAVNATVAELNGLMQAGDVVECHPPIEGG